MRRPVHRFELGVVLAEPVDLVLDLLVGDRQPGHGDLQAVVAGDGDTGRTSTTASKVTAPPSSPDGDVDLGRAMGSTSVSTTARA